jgi:hypothetical protein
MHVSHLWLPRQAEDAMLARYCKLSSLASGSADASEDSELRINPSSCVEIKGAAGDGDLGYYLGPARNDPRSRRSRRAAGPS